VRTPDESRSAQRRGKLTRRAVKTGLALAVGLLLAAGMSASSVGASVKPAVQVAKATSIAPDATAAAIPTCDAGISNKVYEYYTDCTAGTYYYRTVAWCEDGNLALGPEELGSSRKVSGSNCKNDSGLNTANDWGLLYCSTDTGAGTYEGYLNESGDISQFLVNTGGGTIATGGNYICDIDATGADVITDTTPT
jgi:hypothetical protein